MQLLVVPRSMPIVFAIPVPSSLVCVLRKSKPDYIKFSAARDTLILAALGVLLTAGAAGARVQAASTRISADTLATPGAQHASQVEPDAAANGATLVTAFQGGRFVTVGGAAVERA